MPLPGHSVRICVPLHPDPAPLLGKGCFESKGFREALKLSSVSHTLHERFPTQLLHQGKGTWVTGAWLGAAKELLGALPKILEDSMRSLNGCSCVRGV